MIVIQNLNSCETQWQFGILCYLFFSAPAKCGKEGEIARIQTAQLSEINLAFHSNFWEIFIRYSAYSKCQETITRTYYITSIERKPNWPKTQLTKKLNCHKNDCSYKTKHQQLSHIQFRELALILICLKFQAIESALGSWEFDRKKSYILVWSQNIKFVRIYFPAPTQ